MAARQTTTTESKRILVDRLVHALPKDLGALLERFGNSLADYEAFEDEATAEAAAPVFDLSHPGHREALAERLAEIGR